MGRDAARRREGAVNTKPKRGRPKEFDGTPVSVRLPARLHDALSQEALRSGRDLSDVIRRRLSVSQNSDDSSTTAQ